MKTNTIIVLLTVWTISSCNLLNSGSGDGPRTIVFSASDKNETYQIYSMREDGSGIRKLTRHERFSVDPAWSPDGKQIAFATFREAPQGATTLWVMEADGSNQRPLVTHPQTGRPMFGGNPAWSPDGSKLAFDYCVNCEAGGLNHEIFVADLQTGRIDTLTRHPASDTHPTWSPDGSRIVFASNRDYFDAENMRWREDLYVIDLDGNNLSRLTETGNATRPAWSPDDHFIAYEWGRGGNSVYLYEIPAGQSIPIDSGLPFSGYPMWSRDGTKLLVIGRESEAGQPEVRLLDMEMEPPQILQQTGLKGKTVGRDYDWYKQ